MISVYEENGYEYHRYSKLSKQYIFKIPPDQPGTVINGRYVYYTLYQLREKFNRNTPFY